MIQMLLKSLTRQVRTEGGISYQANVEGKTSTATALRKRNMLTMETRVVVRANGGTHQATGAWLTTTALNVLAQRLMHELAKPGDSRAKVFQDFIRAGRTEAEAVARFLLGGDVEMVITVHSETKWERGEHRETLNPERGFLALGNMMSNGQVITRGKEQGTLVGHYGRSHGTVTFIPVLNQGEVEELPVGTTPEQLDELVGEGASKAVYDARYEKGRQGRVYGPVVEALRERGLVKLVPGIYPHERQAVLTEWGIEMAGVVSIERGAAEQRLADERRAVCKPVEGRDRAAGVISDEQLELWKTSVSKGERNSVEALLPLTPKQRRLAVDEARAFMNVTPGWNFSGAVWEAAKLLAYDPDGTKAAAVAARGGSWEGFVADAGRAQQAVVTDMDGQGDLKGWAAPQEAVSASVSAEELLVDAYEYHWDLIDPADGTVVRHGAADCDEAEGFVSRAVAGSVVKGEHGVITLRVRTHEGLRRQVLTPKRPGVVWACKKAAEERQEPVSAPESAGEGEEGMSPQELDEEAGEGAAAALYDAVYAEEQDGRVYGPEGVREALQALRLAEYVPSGVFRNQVVLVVTESGREMAARERARRGAEGAGDESLEPVDLWRVLDHNWQTVTVVFGRTYVEAERSGKVNPLVRAARERGTVGYTRLRRLEVRVEADLMLGDAPSMWVTVMDGTGVSAEVLPRAEVVERVVAALEEGLRLQSLTPLALEGKGKQVWVSERRGE
jgi:hypothetical protein